MTQPLAIVLYEKLLPGSQLVNRLQDLNYRVHAVNGPDALVACAEGEAPMIVLADLESSGADVCASIARLKQNSATRHVPVVAFLDEVGGELEAAARQAGAVVVTSDATILNHLPQLLQQALQVQ